MKKIFYFDTETTNTQNTHPDLSKRGDIIQIAYIIEINGQVVRENEYLLRPIHPENIDPEALKVNGHCREELMTYPDPCYTLKRIQADMGVYCNKFDKNDKFYPCAYNGQFDMNFLSTLFQKCGDMYFGSWFNGQLLDPLPIVRMLSAFDLLSVENHKLLTIAKAMDVEIRDAHDALNDVRMLKDIVYNLHWKYLSSPLVCNSCYESERRWEDLSEDEAEIENSTGEQYHGE